MSTDELGGSGEPNGEGAGPRSRGAAGRRSSPRGAAAAQAGFDYQLDVSILAALQLLLISKAATRIVLEPASEEDLEVDLAPDVPGRVQPSATIAGGQKLVVQIKLDAGEPWRIKDFEALLKHGSNRIGGRRKALHHLDDPNTHYLLVTNADAMGEARALLVEGFEETADRSAFPPSLRATLKSSPEGRIAIWGKLTERQLASDIRGLLTDLLHVPKVKDRDLVERLRLEARRRIRGDTSGIWTREDLLSTVRAYGGFLASSATLDHFVPPANFDRIVTRLNERNAVVLRGPSGTGKTQAALKLCDMARRRDGALEIVTLGVDDGPTRARKVVDTGPTLFYVDDPWGQYSLSGGNEAWTEQLPRLLAKASPGHRFVITSRSDMLHEAGVGESLDPWSIDLDASQYRHGELRAIHDDRMNQLPPPLQTKALAFRREVLDELETPLEVELYFTHLQAGPKAGEEDHPFYVRILALAKRDAVEDVVSRMLSSVDTSGASAIVWALLAARTQFDRGRLHPLQRSLRTLDRTLGESIGKLIDRMVAARHLRQPIRTVTFAHPSVRQGFEAFARANWVRSEAAIATLISALVRLPQDHRAWGLETAARVLFAARTFALRDALDQTFEVDPDSQGAIDAWLDETLVDPSSKFSPLLKLTAEVGSEASIPSRVARWLLKGTQWGTSRFSRNWRPPVRGNDWYAIVSADPNTPKVAARFVREQLGFDQTNYGSGFAELLDRFAPNLDAAYLDAARRMVGNGFEPNAGAVAAGAMRDLVGFEGVVEAALRDLVSLRGQQEVVGPDERRAIEDGERDHAVEVATEWGDDDEGYTSGVFVDAYVRRLRETGRWRGIADHPVGLELTHAWARALLTATDPASEDEVRAILAAGIGGGAEQNVWAAARQHWHAGLEPILAERLYGDRLDPNLRLELALTAVRFAPKAMIAAFQVHAGRAVQPCRLLVALRRAQRRLGKGDGSSKLKHIVAELSPELAEIFDAMRTRNRRMHPIGPSAHALLARAAPRLDSDSLDLLVPVIVTAGGNGSAAIARWLTVADSQEHAVRATDAAIAAADTALIERALRHKRADARRRALLHMASTLPDPLPSAILAMAEDPGSRVRQALVSILAKRPHPDHLRTALTLIHDPWSSAEPYRGECDSFDVAREAVIAVGANEPLSDAVGGALLELAVVTEDRILGRCALMVAAKCCGTSVQERVFDLIDGPGARWTRHGAIEALAEADTVAPGIVARLKHAHLLEAPPILAASAAHLIGTHAPVARAIKLFERAASSNRRRALLLVGAAAMASRDGVAAARILDLLEPGHPGRRLLTASRPLPISILDELGTVQLREAVRERLGDRLAPQ